MSEFSGAPRRHWIDHVATIAALLVSVISLWVAFRTEDANRKIVDANNRMVAAASWPFLQMESGNDQNGKPKITMELENAGVGPAKIQSFEVFWRGRAYGSSEALLKACCSSAQKAPLKTSTFPVRGVVLRAGDQRQIFSLDLTPDDAALWKAFDRVRRQELSYRACYCSVFDECWIGELNQAQPRRVKACPVPATPYDQ